MSRILRAGGEQGCVHERQANINEAFQSIRCDLKSLGLHRVQRAVSPPQQEPSQHRVDRRRGRLRCTRTSKLGSTGNMSVTSSPPGFSSFAQVAAQSFLIGGCSAQRKLQSTRPVATIHAVLACAHGRLRTSEVALGTPCAVLIIIQDIRARRGRDKGVARFDNAHV